MFVIIGFTICLGWIHITSCSTGDDGPYGNIVRMVGFCLAWDIKAATTWHSGGSWNVGQK